MQWWTALLFWCFLSTCTIIFHIWAHNDFLASLSDVAVALLAMVDILPLPETSILKTKKSMLESHVLDGLKFFQVQMFKINSLLARV